MYEEFCRRAAEVTLRLRQGAASGAALVDAGAMCMPGQAEKVQELVDDAVAKGAKVGGVLGAQSMIPTKSLVAACAFWGRRRRYRSWWMVRRPRAPRWAGLLRGYHIFCLWVNPGWVHVHAGAGGEDAAAAGRCGGQGLQDGGISNYKWPSGVMNEAVAQGA